MQRLERLAIGSHHLQPTISLKESPNSKRIIAAVTIQGMLLKVWPYLFTEYIYVEIYVYSIEIVKP